MLPAVFPGDTLIIERTDFAATQQGDIVLVSRNGRLFAHRLLKKGLGAHASGVLTKGDSMIKPDPAVAHDNVIGRVSFIVRNGVALRPRTKLHLSERAIAAVAKRSATAARFVVGFHGLRSARRVERPRD